MFGFKKIQSKKTSNRTKYNSLRLESEGGEGTALVLGIRKGKMAEEWKRMRKMVHMVEFRE